MNQVYSRWLSRMISMLLLLTLLVHTQPAAAATITVGCGNTRVAELIAAIEQANSTPAADTIELAADCVYILTSVHNTTEGPTGLPVISTPLTINGNGASIERSTAADMPAFRFFFMPAAGTLTLRDVTLRNGSTRDSSIEDRGGAIYNNGGMLTIAHSTFSHNTAQSSGGGIFSRGPLTITHSTFSHNTANTGGGIYNNEGEITIHHSTFSHNSAQYGGAIQNASPWSLPSTATHLTIIDSTFSHNSAGYEGGGIWNDGPLTVTHNTFTHNTADEDGGGIFSYGPMTVTHSTFSNNDAYDFGGGILTTDPLTITYSTFSSNTASAGGGISIDNNTPFIFITNSTFSNNTAHIGGGIWNAAPLTIQHSTLRGNTADFFGGAITNYGMLNLHHSTIISNTAETQGGGISNGEPFAGQLRSINSTYGGLQLLVTHSTISGNSATDGGGIYNFGGEAYIQQSTISGNTATQQGGGIWNELLITLEASTITANSATDGGGIWSTGFPTLGQTIVAANTATSGADMAFVYDEIITNGYNLLGSNATVETFFPAGFPNSNGDYVGTPTAPLDPRLGPLANNGGPTLTHMPLVGSPVIDSGPITTTSTTDQRGFTRIYGPRVDIGAVEVQAAVAYTEHIYLPLVRTSAPAQYRTGQ